MRMRTSQVLVWYLTLAAMAGGLSGCGLHQPASRPVSYYQLDYPPPTKVEQRAPLPFVIRVEFFQPSELHSRQRLVYRDGRYATGRYVYHQWITPLDRMIPRLLARDLRHAGIVRAVFLDGAQTATHRLIGSIESFYEEDGQAQWTAVVSFSITLVSTEARPVPDQIRFHQTYTSRQPCPEKTPGAFVHAASQALSDISRRLTADIYEALVKTAPPEGPDR